MVYHYSLFNIPTHPCLGKLLLETLSLCTLQGEGAKDGLNGREVTSPHLLDLQYMIPITFEIKSKE